MRNARMKSLIPAVALFATLSAVGGCGGGGHGFSVNTDPIKITSTAVPNALSGQIVNVPIPFTGGAGGPYVLQVINGALPDGIGTNSATVALTGRLLKDAVFTFTLKLTDTGAQPFSTTTANYIWTIGKGPLVFATDTVVPSFVYNRFDSINLILAGGTPPYSCQVVHDPSFVNPPRPLGDLTPPGDENLPQGLGIPPSSCTVVGAPTGVKLNNPPFIYYVSIQGRDHADNLAYPTPETKIKNFTFSVLVPAVVISTVSLPNGICGTPYTSKIDIVDGIPPFNHRVVSAIGTGGINLPWSKTRMLADPLGPDPIAKSNAFGIGILAPYALDNSAGPYTSKFPEGLFIRDATGDIIGTPRRAGTFNAWIYWVQSNVLPNVDSQNSWKAYNFSMADGAPPNLTLSTAVLQAGSTFSTPPANVAPNFLPSLEAGIPYSKTFAATGGVLLDGKFDGPNESQATQDITVAPFEAVGGVKFLPPVFGAPGALASMTFNTSSGVWSGTPLGSERSGLRTMTINVTDAQLPTTLVTGHATAGLCQFDVGPDWAVITESTTSVNSAQLDTTYNYNTQTVEIFEASTSSPTVRPLNAADMASTHTHPTGNTLPGSLTNIDLLTVSVNPTWWAYDIFNLCAKGARAYQHSDIEKKCGGNGYGANTFNHIVNCANNGQNDNNGQEYISEPAIELPTIPAAVLVPNAAAGIYTNGGLLYCYDNATEFGFFIVRKDSRIQIPVAITKGTFQGFGDAWLTNSSGASQMFRCPQITVSPDGRTAAAKLKLSVTSFAETQGPAATGEKIVLFNLSGEKPFGGTTFRVIQAGGTGTVTDGQYIYADTLALTNRFLYFLKGNNIGTVGVANSDRVMYNDHWVYKYDFVNDLSPQAVAGTAGLMTAPVGAVGGWTAAVNVAGAPIGCKYNRWSTPGNTGLPSFGQSTFAPTTGTGAPTNGVPTGISPDFFVNHWSNFWPGSCAPIPFRVSADGTACAIVAASQQLPASVNFMTYSIYVDNTGGTFREASTTRRHYKSGSRLGGLHDGEQNNRLYGWYDGPATQLEISDDGKRIAVVYNSNALSWTNSGAANANLASDREEIEMLTGTTAGADPFATTTVTAITSGIFTGSLMWRFGNIAWMRDTSGFVFWGGYGLFNPTVSNSTNNEAVQQSGSLYSYNINLATPVEGILPLTAGGHSQVSGTSFSYSGASQNNVTYGNWTGGQGSVGSVGSFFSNDGNFFYVESMGALTTSADTGFRFVAVNVKGNPATAANTINGKIPLRAFAPTWPSRYGFSPTGYYYYPNMYLRSALGGPSASLGTAASVGSSNGQIFYTSYNENQPGTTGDIATSSFNGGGPANPTAWYDFGSRGAELFTMKTDVGGDPINLTNLGSPTAFRIIPYFQASNDGSKVAYVKANTSGSFSFDHGPSQETVSVATNITFTAAGSLATAVTNVVLEGSVGRASSSVSFDSSGNKVFYGFIVGGSNENGMRITTKTLNGTGTAVSTTATIGGILAGAGNPDRFAVLSAGR